MAVKDSGLDQARLEFAKGVIAQYGDKIPPHIQADILGQRVSIGMPPYEAYLAAGQCNFQVSADRSRWPANADPFKVIQAQTLHPDDSEISMFFENATQFPDKGKSRFKVSVRRGRVVSVDLLEPIA